jgi:hypothetical protein
MQMMEKLIAKALEAGFDAAGNIARQVLDFTVAGLPGSAGVPPAKINNCRVSAAKNK